VPRSQNCQGLVAPPGDEGRVTRCGVPTAWRSAGTCTLGPLCGCWRPGLAPVWGGRPGPLRQAGACLGGELAGTERLLTGPVAAGWLAPGLKSWVVPAGAELPGRPARAALAGTLRVPAGTLGELGGVLRAGRLTADGGGRVAGPGALSGDGCRPGVRTWMAGCSWADSGLTAVLPPLAGHGGWTTATKAMAAAAARPVTSARTGIGQSQPLRRRAGAPGWAVAAGAGRAEGSMSWRNAASRTAAGSPGGTVWPAASALKRASVCQISSRLMICPGRSASGGDSGERGTRGGPPDGLRPPRVVKLSTPVPRSPAAGQVPGAALPAPPPLTCRAHYRFPPRSARPPRAGPAVP